MVFSIKTAHGFLSFQPPKGKSRRVRVEYRDDIEHPEAWELCDVGGLEALIALLLAPTPPPPAPPAPLPDNGWNLPLDAAQMMQTTAGRRIFILKARLIAYHDATEETIVYWLGKADEMIARGVELGEGLRYFWERLLGRGAGGDDVAIDGPYKGRANYEGSLTE